MLSFKTRILKVTYLLRRVRLHNKSQELKIPRANYWLHSQCVFSGAGAIMCQYVSQINPLNAELNPICYLLALLGAHHFLHVGRIRVKSLTLRLLMSYIYIYIYIYIWSTYS